MSLDFRLSVDGDEVYSRNITHNLNKMAEAAGWAPTQLEMASEAEWARLERFAALVAATEREACAKVVDGNIAASTPGSRLNDILMSNAAAIRARRTP